MDKEMLINIVFGFLFSSRLFKACTIVLLLLVTS